MPNALLGDPVARFNARSTSAPLPAVREDDPGPWVQRSSSGERIRLRKALRAVLRAGSRGERDRLLVSAGRGRHALLDLMVDTQGLPSELLPPACQALATLGPQVEERALVMAVRHLLLETPGPLLTRLGELARRARGESCTLAEQALLGLLERTRRQTQVAWDRLFPLVRALARGGGLRAVRPLVALLREADPLNREALVMGEALAGIAARGHERSVVGHLIVRLRRSDQEAERYFGHVALGLIGSRYAGPYLEQQVAEGVARRSAGTALRPSFAAALHALGRLDSPEAVRTLLSLEARVEPGDLVLREALYAALGQARRTAPGLGLIPLLVDWLGAAEKRHQPRWVTRALGEALVSLTGHRAPPQHRAWFAYLVAHGARVRGQQSPPPPQPPQRRGTPVDASPSRRILRPQLVFPKPSGGQPAVA